MNEVDAAQEERTASYETSQVLAAAGAVPRLSGSRLPTVLTGFALSQTVGSYSTFTNDGPWIAALTAGQNSPLYPVPPRQASPPTRNLPPPPFGTGSKERDRPSPSAQLSTQPRSKVSQVDKLILVPARQRRESGTSSSLPDEDLDTSSTTHLDS
ncbi:hypothetical protein C8Q80DRAFT_1349916 [Daedaleopsis nitida]|nr:hypothetical protein C8Q80DRAFT_1349916 [Daedaleopsis nitida]